MWAEIAMAFQNGDRYIYWMLGITFLATIILFERWIMLQFVFNIDVSKFSDSLKKAVKAEDMDRAAQICRAGGRGSLAGIGLKAVEAASSDPSTVRATIEEESLAFIPRIDSRIGILPAFATIVMLIGVLGTINALWDAFHTLDVLDTKQKQVAIGNGIAEALNYSAVGIVAAMCILFFHQVLRGMALRIVDKIQLGVTVLHNLLVPAEVAFVAHSAPASAPVAMQAATAPSAPPPPPQAAIQEVEENDPVEETPVEDIKDEEEII